MGLVLQEVLQGFRSEKPFQTIAMHLEPVPRQECATMVIFAASEKHVREGVRGAVAIALAHEVDYLRAPEPADRDPAIHVDENGRIQIYPVLARLSSIPIAVIQSTNDRYVPSAESRRLMGPDTSMLRLYEVKARNHGFDGGRDELLRDLDEALKWIEGAAGN